MLKKPFFIRPKGAYNVIPLMSAILAMLAICVHSVSLELLVGICRNLAQMFITIFKLYIKLFVMYICKQGVVLCYDREGEKVSARCLYSYV